MQVTQGFDAKALREAQEKALRAASQPLELKPAGTLKADSHVNLVLPEGTQRFQYKASFFSLFFAFFFSSRLSLQTNGIL
jgi:hypothetical protein